MSGLCPSWKSVAKIPPACPRLSISLTSISVYLGDDPPSMLPPHPLTPLCESPRASNRLSMGASDDLDGEILRPSVARRGRTAFYRTCSVLPGRAQFCGLVCISPVSLCGRPLACEGLPLALPAAPWSIRHAVSNGSKSLSLLPRPSEPLVDILHKLAVTVES